MVLFGFSQCHCNGWSRSPQSPSSHGSTWMVSIMLKTSSQIYTQIVGLMLFSFIYYYFFRYSESFLKFLFNVILWSFSSWKLHIVGYGSGRQLVPTYTEKRTFICCSNLFPYSCGEGHLCGFCTWTLETPSVHINIHGLWLFLFCTWMFPIKYINMVTLIIWWRMAMNSEYKTYAIGLDRYLCALILDVSIGFWGFIWLLGVF